jgi:hypothetical protein
MAMQQVQSLDGLVRALRKLLTATTVIVALTATCSTAAISLLFLGRLYTEGTQGNPNEISEKYAAAFAVVALVTLTVMSFSLALQSKQFKYVRQADHRQRTRDTVRIALENPAYAQCWGPRFAPDHVDERLFFYCAFVVLNWAHAWDDGLLAEARLRDLLKAYFDSEVPRMYWERNGDWNQLRRRWPRRVRFLDIVNEEYLTAIKGGPPARGYEPLTIESSISGDGHLF